MTRPGPGPPGLPPQEGPAGSAVGGHSDLHNRVLALPEFSPIWLTGSKKVKPNKLVSIPEEDGEKKKKKTLLSELKDSTQSPDSQFKGWRGGTFRRRFGLC